MIAVLIALSGFPAPATLFIPSLADVVASSAQPARVRHALDLFAPAPGLEDDERILAWAAGVPRDDGSEGLVAPRQGARSLHALETSAEARSVVDALAAQADSDGERALLLKEAGIHALDAHFSADMTALAERIRGKPLAWLLAHTTAYGTALGDGVRQTFRDSCMPAISIVAEAEADPLAALRLHDDAHWVAETERDELVAYGGIPAGRDTAEPGRGTTDHALLLHVAGDLGTHPEVIAREDFDATTLDRMAALLADGVDVPLRIATAADTVAHSVIAVDVKQDDAGRFFRIHDPWTGKSTWVRDDDVRSGWLIPTDGGTKRHVTHVYLFEP